MYSLTLSLYVRASAPYNFSKYLSVSTFSWSLLGKIWRCSFLYICEWKWCDIPVLLITINIFGFYTVLCFKFKLQSSLFSGQQILVRIKKFKKRTKRIVYVRARETTYLCIYEIAPLGVAADLLQLNNQPICTNQKFIVCVIISPSESDSLIVIGTPNDNGNSMSISLLISSTTVFGKTIFHTCHYQVCMFFVSW